MSRRKYVNLNQFRVKMLNEHSSNLHNEKLWYLKVIAYIIKGYQHTNVIILKYPRSRYHLSNSYSSVRTNGEIQKQNKPISQVYDVDFLWSNCYKDPVSFWYLSRNSPKIISISFHMLRCLLRYTILEIIVSFPATLRNAMHIAHIDSIVRQLVNYEYLQLVVGECAAGSCEKGTTLQ